MAHALTLEADRQPEAATLDLIRRLIAFDTVSERSNLALIEFVAGYLDDLGIASELVYDEGHGKANLYATLGPADRSGIALSGHTDVVPVEGQPWDSDPFEVLERDGRLYGRGTSDMKSFIAVCLALAPEFLAREIAIPLHMVFSYDEEVGCLGVRGLIDILRDREVKPRAVFVGEPTEMQVVRAHKGKLSYRTHVRGLEAHSGMAHLGVNAVEAAAEAIAYLKGMARKNRDQGPFDEALVPPYTTVHTGLVKPAAPSSTSCRGTAISTSSSGSFRTKIAGTDVRDLPRATCTSTSSRRCIGWIPPRGFATSCSRRFRRSTWTRIPKSCSSRSRSPAPTPPAR